MIFLLGFFTGILFTIFVVPSLIRIYIQLKVKKIVKSVEEVLP